MLADIVKMYRLLIFFKYGYYISLLIWMCGMCFSMFRGASAEIKIAVILATLGVYVFFTSGKEYWMEKY